MTGLLAAHTHADRVLISGAQEDVHPMDRLMQHRAARSVHGQLANLFEPDVLVPAQFFARYRAQARSGEMRLLLAVLEDGIATFQQHVRDRDRKGRQLFRDAAEWIESPCVDGPFTFEVICDALGIDAEYLRAGLRRWRERVGSPEPLAADENRWPPRRFVALRAQLQWTYRQIAAHLDVPISTVDNWPYIVAIPVRYWAALDALERGASANAEATA